MKGIFDIKTEQDFREKCLETFRYQYENVEVYRKFDDFLKNTLYIPQNNQLAPQDK